MNHNDPMLKGLGPGTLSRFFLSAREYCVSWLLFQQQRQDKYSCHQNAQQNESWSPLWLTLVGHNEQSYHPSDASTGFIRGEARGSMAGPACLRLLENGRRGPLR